MSVWAVPGSFASIALAVADILVVDGDTIEIQAGYTETLTVALNVNKQLTFIGMGANPGSVLIQTAGTAGDPTTMITIADDNITFRNIEFRHNKTTNTATERIFNSSALYNLTLDTCNLYHMEFGVVGVYEDLTIQDCLFQISNTSPLNQNFHITLTGIKGTFNFLRNTFDALAGATQTRFIALSANATYPYANGGDCTVNVYGNTWDGVGNLNAGVYFARFDFIGAGIINLDCRNNTWDCATGGLGCYRLNATSPDTNVLSNFGSIRFSGNRHNTITIGMLSIGGTIPGSPKALGAITGDWTLCNNHISGSISSASYSKYHFGAKHPSANKIFGVQNAVFTNPYPTNNPYQTYIDCAAGGNFSQYLLRVQRTPYHQHKYNRRLF